MKRHGVLVVFATLTVAAQNKPVPSPVGLWRSMDRNIRWVYAPKHLGYKERGGGATILRLTADHSFALIYDTVYQRNGQENASEGDSWSMYYGTWRKVDGNVLVDYAPAYIDIPRVENGHMVCDRPVKARPLRFAGAHLIFGKDVLQRAPKLESSVNRLLQPSASWHPDSGSCGNYANGQVYKPAGP